MVYTTLSTLLYGDNELPPVGECHLITDSLEADGNFLLHHYVAAFLRASTSTVAASRPQVVFMGTGQIFSHYAAIGKKLGINVVAAKSKGQLYFMDLLSRFTVPINANDTSTSRPDTALSKVPTAPTRSFAWMAQSNDNPSTIDWEASLQAVVDSLRETICAGNGNDTTTLTTRTVVVVDDLTALLFAGCPVQIVVGFARILRRLCDTHQINLVILAHDDLTFEADAEHDLCMKLIARLPHTILAVQGLESGVSRDVHGQITLMRGAASVETDRSTKFHPRLLHYRLLENGAQFFAPGYASSVI
ncbi:hypothetical protein BDF19DRAFT_462272 [Syncephalis fuscata]|nr:hypothetical protein BDF19DRAFT_462272 [Syncephalis fuscata]